MRFTGYNLRVTVQVLDLNHRYVSDVSGMLIDGQVNLAFREPVNSSLTLTLLDPDSAIGFDTQSPSDGALYADRMIKKVNTMATLDQQLRYATAIITAMSRGPATPCTVRGWHLWASTIASERQQAARLCRDCVILQRCGEIARANKQTSGVWGGRDFGP